MSRTVSIGDLVRGIDSISLAGDPTATVTGIEYDSRLVEPGFLFVAIRGGYVDGHTYLAQAHQRGATAALVATDFEDPILDNYSVVLRADDTRAALAPLATNYYDHPGRAMTLVGVTGTDGKTTTTYFIEAMLRHAGLNTGMIGTISVRTGGHTDAHESRQTTPESLVVQRYLDEMRSNAVDAAVLEATSHGLILNRVDGCDFDIGVVTNVTREHLDFHGSIENYRAAKGQLLARVDAARSIGRMGVCVVNADDYGARTIESFKGRARIVHYSASGTAVEVFAENVISDAHGSSFTVVTPAGASTVTIALPGAYNVDNALAAAATGWVLGLSPETIAAGLASLESVPGRMHSVRCGQPFGVIVDYAHTPEAIRSVLREVRKLGHGRLILVMGSAGERDVEKRALQGAIAITDADFAVFTSEDPRFENPDAVIEDIARGARQAGGVEHVDFEAIEDRRDAIRRALLEAKPGDLVVLAGKGHEQSMIYGATKRPWDEARVAAELLAELSLNDSQESAFSR